MQTDDYHVPKARVSTEYEIKKSRFIGIAFYAEDRDCAMAGLDDIRREYPDARHHCWAYLIGPPHAPLTVAMSDDGEPNGTAGKPILNVLQHKGVGDVMLVVARYFGGIKLGAGGLVRAYSTTAEMTMTALESRLKIFLTALTVKGDYALEQSLRHWLGQHRGELAAVEYLEQVNFQVNIQQQDVDVFIAWLVAHGGEMINVDSDNN